MSTKIETLNAAETLKTVIAAVNKATDVIKPTFGPSSNKVIISNQYHRITVDDGVQIARDLKLPDRKEEAVWQTAKEVAIRTNDRVGDGTTGSLIMLQAIVNEAARKPRFDGRSLEKELRAGAEKAKKQLLAMAQEVKTREELELVARVSFDDPKIAKLIGDAWYELGEDGTLTIDRSGTMQTFSELTEGVKIERGYVSPYMVTNIQRMESVVEKPYMLLTDYRLTETNDILGIMNLLAGKHINNLVLLCETIEGNALATAIVNKMQGKFNLVAVAVPGSAEERTAFLEDVALMTGGRLFSEKKGDKLETATVDDLGRADKFVAHREDSVIVNPRGSKSVVKKSIIDLRAAIAAATDEKLKKELRLRLTRFCNKVGVIRVGAATESEERALRFKVEDAVNAVHSAFKSGVAPGAGLALASLKTGSTTLDAALKEPQRQLLRNVGAEPRELKEGEAYNAVTGKVGPFMKVGVADPVEVLVAQVESAVSIAAVLLTCSGLTVEYEDESKQ